MLKFWLCPALEKPLKDYSATTIQRWKLAEEKNELQIHRSHERRSRKNGPGASPKHVENEKN